MFQAQIRKRLIPRLFEPYFPVVHKIREAVSPDYADGKSVSFESGEPIKTLISTDCDKFDCSILSLIGVDSSACFTTGFMCLLYNKLKQILIRNALLHHQFYYALKLEVVSALILR